MYISKEFVKNLKRRGEKTIANKEVKEVEEIEEIEGIEVTQKNVYGIVSDIAKWIGAEARRRGRDRLVMYRTVGILGFGLAASLLVNAATILGYIDWTPSSGSVDAAKVAELERRLADNEARAKEAHQIGSEALLLSCDMISTPNNGITPRNCRQVADRYYGQVSTMEQFPSNMQVPPTPAAR